jgi:hypothetical protein
MFTRLSQFGVRSLCCGLKILLSHISGIWAKELCFCLFFAVIYLCDVQSQDFSPTHLTASYAIEHGIKMTSTSGVGLFSAVLTVENLAAKRLASCSSPGEAFRRINTSQYGVTLSKPTLLRRRCLRHQKHVTGPLFKTVKHWKC